MSLRRQLDFALGVPAVRLLSLFGARRLSRPESIRKLLIIKLAAMGDTVLLIPVLRSLRRAYPDIQLDWLASPINQALASTVPYVNRLHIWSNKINTGTLASFRHLKNESYDVVIDFEQWARGTALLSFFLGIPIRVGFDTPGQHRSALYTETYLKKFDRHEIEDFFVLASNVFNLEKDTRLELWETEPGKREYVHVLERYRVPSSKRKILIHPGCGSDGRPREWPLENYAVLSHWLVRKYEANLFFTSGPEETNKTSALNRLIHGGGIDLGGGISWQGLVSLVAGMDLVISGNTGVMHIAAALGKPQVALHGPTNPVLWGPLNPHARVIASPCGVCPTLKLGFEYHRRDSSCMSQISIESVKQTISALIDNPK